MRTLLAIALIALSSPSTITYVAEPEPPPLQIIEVVEAEVTAYTSSPEETWGDPFETASGERVRDGVLACPSWLEFGQEVEIEGKRYTCLDRMNKRYRDGNHFDIWMEQKEDAINFGRKDLSVYIFR